MKQFTYIIFVLFLALGYTNQSFAQTSDQYGELIDEETVQHCYELLQRPLFRFGSNVYLQDDMGEYWLVDTTRVIVHVNRNLMPENVDWRVNQLGFATVFVPKDERVEDYAKYLWDLPWVVIVEYDTGAKQGFPDYYFPYLQEGKAWKTVEKNGGEYTYRIKGDTIIGGEWWKKVYSDVDESDDSYYGAIRQDRYKVFAIAKGTEIPRLLYDFSLKVGDKLRCGSESAIDFVLGPDDDYDGWTASMELKSINTITVQELSPSDTKELRCFIFEVRSVDKNMALPQTVVWVEGVGSEYGLFHSWSTTPSDSKVSCYMKNKLLFNADEFHLVLETDYRPFIEEGKVWKVGHADFARPNCYGLSTYYFDGDTIVGGKLCKRMMCKAEEKENMEEDLSVSISIKYVGAIREEGRKVYLALPNEENFNLLYDFESEVGMSIEAYSKQQPEDASAIPCVIYNKTHGRFKNSDGSPSYKGAYVEIYALHPDVNTAAFTQWMEGVGMDATPVFGHYMPEWGFCHRILLSCTVGDEVIYKNTDYIWEGIEPDAAETLTAKKRVDFTHVVKKKPKAPQRRVVENDHVSISGEFSKTELTIDLGALEDTYAVTITDASGQAVYAKDVKTNRVLGLNIDISNYTGDAYTITLENEDEIFTGKFCLSDLTDIRDVTTPSTISTTYYDLTGHPVTTPSKGIYIRNGRKVLVK